MESLEIKDATAGTEEPIKSETMVPSPDTSERSNSASSPPPNCSICLGKLVNTSFTDSCLHQFCFTCLLQWSKIKTECPLCKQTFKSIIHNVRSEGDYDQYHVQFTSQVAATLDVTGDIHISGQWDVALGVGVPVRPFMYRTTMGANRRYGMLLNPEAVARREQVPAIAPQISNEERRRRNANPIDYRRTVYRHGVWAASLPDAFGRFRESSAEYYRLHPAEVDRLVPWLNRELQVLLNNNQPHIAYVMSVITDSVTRHDIHSAEFRNIIRPYFGIHADHFVHEFSNFARTNFDLVGYDQTVTYLPNRSMYRGLTNEFVHRAVSPTLSTSSSSSSSNDSDVRVLEDAFDPRRLNSFNMPSAGPHMIDMPGPSTVGQAFRLQLPMNYTYPDVLTISSTSSSSENECEVVGYVKPRHERTPEIIDLSSSDAEEINVTTQTLSTSNDSIDNNPTETTSPMKEENMPSTSSSCANSTDASASRRTRRQAEDIVKVQMYEYLNSSSSSDSDESDSDYNPQTNKRTRRHKTTSKKSPQKTRSKLRARKSRKTVQRKREAIYSSCNSENENPQRTTSSSRGTKRYLSKSSDGTESEKVSKKCKKSKKSKSSKKSKKRTPVKKYISSSSSSSSDSEKEKEEEQQQQTQPQQPQKQQKKTKKRRHSSEETRRSRYEDSNSSSESNDRLRIDEDADQHCTTDEDGSVYSDEANFNSSPSKRKTTTTTNDENEQSSLTKSSNKSTKRHRSHKKRKESKKRRRSRS